MCVCGCWPWSVLTGFGGAAEVEITELFAWAAGVICYDELYKSRATKGNMTGPNK